MNIILFDTEKRTNLFPLTFTRPIADLRVGILKLSEKWEKYLKATVSFKTADYLSTKYPAILSDKNYWVDSSIIVNRILADEIDTLKERQVLVFRDTVIAYISDIQLEDFDAYEKVETQSNPIQINYPWDIFSNNHRAIEEDFELVTHGRISVDISSTNTVIGDSTRLFVEEGVDIECAILNTKTGPIYIGKNSVILEGSLVRGALAMNEGSLLKMGTKVYGATTMGKFSKLGGEVNNSVVYDFSNKGHEGFLGNSVLGEWCNIGADTNNSNLKNNYQPVKLWNYNTERFIPTGLQFCGLIMGDHSKTGINTMFNTGTVVGVAANVFGADYPRNFIPSFSWGITRNQTFKMNKVLEMAEAMMGRRNLPLTSSDVAILEEVFNQTKKYRTWEKA